MKIGKFFIEIRGKCLPGEVQIQTEYNTGYRGHTLAFVLRGFAIRGFTFAFHTIAEAIVVSVRMYWKFEPSVLPVFKQPTKCLAGSRVGAHTVCRF